MNVTPSSRQDGFACASRDEEFHDPSRPLKLAFGGEKLALHCVSFCSRRGRPVALLTRPDVVRRLRRYDWASFPHAVTSVTGSPTAWQASSLVHRLGAPRPPQPLLEAIMRPPFVYNSHPFKSDPYLLAIAHPPVIEPISPDYWPIPGMGATLIRLPCTQSGPGLR
jgi:hypothetical protein